MTVEIDGPWGRCEQAEFWARVLSHPRRSRAGGPLLPPHPEEIARIKILLAIACGRLP